MIKVLALSSLETILNHYLQLDPDTMAKLPAIAGNAIEINIEDWNARFFVYIETDELQLLAEYNDKINTKISGKLFRYLHLIKSGSNAKSAFENKIRVEGDAELALKLQNILSHIDIDWEEHLSKIIGDSFAHRISFGIKQAIDYGRHVVSTVKSNTIDYFQQEALLLPTHEQVEMLFNDINSLRNDVDRLSARIDPLKSTKSRSP